jgi:hypothetical protein
MAANPDTNNPVRITPNATLTNVRRINAPVLSGVPRQLPYLRLKIPFIRQEFTAGLAKPLADDFFVERTAVHHLVDLGGISRKL